VSRGSRDLKLAFEAASLRIPLNQIEPLREVSDRIKKSVKYKQIAASIQEVGIIEPPVVARDAQRPDTYHLLDGHFRVEILKELDIKAVVCLVATDDEAYTYNKRVNRLAIIQEHKMILMAIQKGVPEERLAKALNVNISSIRSRRRLLEGICPEAVDLLRDKHVAILTFTELRKLKPMRQIEAAELMIAMNNYTISYARSLVAATPEDQLVIRRRRRVKGLTPDQIAKMEAESANLQREFKAIEADHGADHLDLVVATGYVGRLLADARVVRYLAQFQPEILAEFQKIIELPRAA
jgi:ParB-like chromosome segregation protein Spo0J